MLVRSVIYGWGFDFMRPFHSKTVISICEMTVFSCFLITLKNSKSKICSMSIFPLKM